jgi:hypothetical protein
MLPGGPGAWRYLAAALPGGAAGGQDAGWVTCVRLDATVTFAHSDKELAEANFKGYDPLTGVCDNTGGEPLAWMPRCGSAGPDTAADHLAITDAAIAAIPPQFKRKLMVTCDGGGVGHALIRPCDPGRTTPGLVEPRHPAGCVTLM